MTDGKIINPIPALRKDPVVTAEQALTAEAAWHDAEPPVAVAKTAAGMEPASNAATFFENKHTPKKRRTPDPHKAGPFKGSALLF